MDFLDELIQSQQEEDHRIPASVLEIPLHDRALFEQLRGNPKISDITDEIAFNKYLRILLQREFEKWAYDSKKKMIQDVLVVAEEYAADKFDEVELARQLEDILPAQALAVGQVKMLSKLLETSGKLAEQHKKITEGIEIKVNMADAGVITRLLVMCVYPCVPRDIWEAIKLRARSFAPSMGSPATLDLE